MVRLSDFTSIFSVSIALHLAYSLLIELHSGPIGIIEKNAGKLASFIQAMDVTSDERMILMEGIFIAETALLKMKPIKGLINVFIAISFCVAIVGLNLLILAASKPDMIIQDLWMSIILLFLFLPMPTFLLITFLKQRNAVKMARNSLNTTQDKILQIRAEKISIERFKEL